MTILTPAKVYRNWTVDGVPTPGTEHTPIKAEIVQLLENMQDNDGAAVSRTTLADLQLVTPTAGTFPRGEVKDDPDPANNGFYSWDADTSEWVFDRPFPDTLAVVTLSGTGAAQTGTVNSGVNPSSTVEFRSEVAVENTGPLTLSIGGEEPRPVVNLAGNALSAGEWTGVVKFFIDDLGNYKLANNPGSEAAAAQSATDAAAQKGYAEEWAQSDEPISVDAGGDGVTDRSAKWHADRSGTYVSIAAGHADTAQDLVTQATAGFEGFLDNQSYDFGSVAATNTYFNQDWGTL